MRLRFARSATRDLTRLRDFSAGHNPGAAARPGRRLGRAIRLLKDQPELGQAVEDLPMFGNWWPPATM
jgi:plasmid stabilization system protein ParE